MSAFFKEVSKISIPFEFGTYFSSRMNILKKLEDSSANKPYNGFAKLHPDFYRILSFRCVKNKFGVKTDGSNRSVIVELEDEILFLPQHFCQKLTNEDIYELNSCIESDENFYLFFGGKHGTNK